MRCSTSYKANDCKNKKEEALAFPLFVTPAGFKPTTSGTGILRSIQLNYEAFVTYCAAKVSIFVGLSKCVGAKYKGGLELSAWRLNL